MSKWKEYTVGEAPLEIIDGDRGINYPKQDDFSLSGYCLFLNAKNVSKSGFMFDSYEFISKQKDDQLRKGKLCRYDTVLTTRGTVGNVAYYGGNIPFENIRINSGMVIIRPKRDELHPLYCYYIFVKLQSELDTYISGTAQPQLPIKDMVRIPITLPPLPVQCAIAEVLSSLDDKIDLLTRQNATLEALAQTYFRQWFVEEAQPDWREVELGFVVDTCSGGTPSREIMEYYENGTIGWVKSKELRGSFILDTEEKITESALNNSSAKILPENSILIAMYGATVGEYAITTGMLTCNQAVCALKPNNEYPYTFLFAFAKYNKKELVNMAIGSAQQNISQELIRQLLLPVCADKITEFHNTVKGFFDKIKANQQQILTLQTLRDTLLPKLISGEVRIKQDGGGK